MQFAPQVDAENGHGLANAKNQLAGKNLLPQANSRRALGDIGNLVGGFNQKVHVGKDKAAAEACKDGAQARTGVLTRRAAAQLAAASGGPAPANAQGAAKPRVGGLRPRDSNLPVVSAQGPVERKPHTRRSLSQVLQDRSEVAVSSGGKGKAAEVCPPSPLPDIDACDKDDPLAATDFVADIFSYYKRMEPVLRVSPDYMAQQGDINDKMRAILIDWLVDVHLKFKLLPETLYLTTNLIDRFLEKKQVTRKHLQLVGVTAMLIASKYEEIWAPEVRDFVYISDRAYTRDQILNMEKIMLNVLRFNLTVPTPYSFLSRFSKAAGAVEDKEVVQYANYLVELSLPDYTMLKYPYSMLSAASIYAANLALGRSPAYSHPLQRHSGYTEEALRPCAATLANLHRKAPNNSLTAVYKKYSSEKLLQVAKMESPVALLSAEAPLE